MLSVHVKNDTIFRSRIIPRPSSILQPKGVYLKFCGGRDFFAQGDYFVVMRMSLITQKTLGI